MDSTALLTGARPAAAGPGHIQAGHPLSTLREDLTGNSETRKGLGTNRSRLRNQILPVPICEILNKSLKPL